MKIRKSLIALTLLAMVFTVSGCSGGSDKESKKEEDKKEPVVSMVANDVYVEPVNPTNAQITAYNKLSAALENQDTQEEAKQVAVSFAFDFFTLSNKKDQSDLGGLEFIPTAYINKFKDFATAYYYGNYPTIVNEYGKDSLPEVSDVQISGFEEAQGLQYNTQPVEGYYVDLKVTYKEGKIPVDKLKTSMKVTLIRMYDYDYNPETDYSGNYAESAQPKQGYRVLALD